MAQYVVRRAEGVIRRDMNNELVCDDVMGFAPLNPSDILTRDETARIN